MIPPVSARCWNAVGRLAGDPCPAESGPYGSPDLRRLRLGGHEINGDVVSIWHFDRGRTSG